MRLCLLVIFLFLFGASFAQIKVDATPTGKHARVIDKAKETRTEIKERKRQAKELKREIKEKKRKTKKAAKLYKQKYDSMKNRQLKLKDLDILSKEDSLAISREILEETNFPQEYVQYLKDPPIDSAYIQNQIGQIDSVALEKTERELSEVANEYAGEHLKETDIEEALPFKPSEVNPNMIKPDSAMQLFEKIDAEKFSELQSKLEEHKKKYTDMVDTRYPEEGTKRNSTSDIPFSKRIYSGGTLHLKSTDPLVLSGNIQFGYWFSKKWLMGIGLVLQEQFNQEDSTSLLEDGYGASLFARYDLPKSFFGWVETEFQKQYSIFGEKQPSTSSWDQAYLVGVGREFKLGRVSMMSILMYDLNYQSNKINSRPLVFKVGFQFTKKPE